VQPPGAFLIQEILIMVLFVDAGFGRCRFSLWDGHTPADLRAVCGEAVVRGKPYCPEHMQVCTTYQGGTKRTKPVLPPLLKKGIEARMKRGRLAYKQQAEEAMRGGAPNSLDNQSVFGTPAPEEPRLLD
jgi:hypothetical protein